MASPSIKFKKLLVKLNSLDRTNVINALCNWSYTITPEQDPRIHQVSDFFQRLQSQANASKQALEGDWVLWTLANSLNESVSFQAVVKNKLGVPKKKIEPEAKKSPPHKTIPKKTREAVWTKQFGSTLEGNCYCCKEKITALGTWHAGHVIAQSNGGPDTAENLRAVCLACNQAMATENMEDFKKRCYP